MNVTASTPEAYQLLHDGSLALSQIEANGIRVDVEYLDGQLKEIGQQIKQLEAELRKSDVGRTWRREYGPKMNMGSGQQLGKILFDVMGFETAGQTATGQHKTGATAIETVDHPFVRDYVQLERLKKTRGTFLKGIQREVTSEGYVHVNFNLHTVSTFRSSSNAFNFQNLPIRDPEQGAIVRRCFIPRKKKNRIVEIDIGGAEVGIAACYHQDPRMIKYIKDPSKDMHRDMAAKCFHLKPGEVCKQTRYAAKNMFVFPQFYGDYYLNNATQLWEFMERMDLTVKESDELLIQRLEDNGIYGRGACVPGEDTEDGTFEDHIKKIQNHFWDKLFPVYRDWKKAWYAEYRRNGYFVTKTGFRIEGDFGRNDVINYPVQGSAFHCLLWVLIRIQRKLKKLRMRTKLIGQIHDSLVADVPDNEVEDYFGLVHEYMTKHLPRAWPWIIVPLEVEADVTPLGGTWHDKEPWDL